MLTHREKAQSLQILAHHHDKIREMVGKIESYNPQFTISKAYSSSRTLQKLKQRQRYKDRLFEQNLRMLHRINSVSHKVSTRSSSCITINSKGSKSTKLSMRFYPKDQPKNQIPLRNLKKFQQKDKELMIDSQQFPFKIECWAPKKLVNLSQIMKIKRRQEQQKILEKYRQISKQISKISPFNKLRCSSIIATNKNNSTITIS